MSNTIASDKHTSVHTVEHEYIEASGTLAVTPSNDVSSNNYHGLTFKTVGVYSAVVLISFSGLMNVIGAGAFARNIAASLGGSADSIWLSQTSAIAVTLLGPPIAQAADYWGRKWFVVSTTLLGFIGCIVVSRATSMNMAIAGEVLAAVGYGSQALLNAIASEILPRRFRPAAQGGLALTSGMGAAFSLLFGFHMVSTSADGWRVYWYLTAGLILLAALVFGVFYNPPPRPLQKSLSQAEKLHRLDWIAYGLLAVGVILFNLALTWADNPYSWKDAHVLGPLIIGLLALVGLAIHQAFFRKDGLCNHEIFKQSRNCAIAFICIFVEGITFFAVNSFFPFEASLLFETDSFRVGVRMSITFFAAMISAAAVSVYSSITRDLRTPTVLAFLSMIIFTILMATITLDSGNAAFAYPVFLGLGLGTVVANVTTIAQFSAPASFIAITSGLIAGARSFGGSIALPIFNSIFNSTISKNLVPSIIAEVIPAGLSPSNLPQFLAALAAQDKAALMAVPGVTPQIIAAGVQGLHKGYLPAFRNVWIAAGAFTLVATVAACFIVNPKPDLNMHVDAPLEKSETNTAIVNT